MRWDKTSYHCFPANEARQCLGGMHCEIAFKDRAGEVFSKCTEKKGFKQVLERSDGVLGFSKTKIYFEQKEIDQKLANGHAK